MIEVGETYSSTAFYVRDPDGNLDDAGSATYTMTLPSGFVQAPAPLAHDATGTYSFDYLTAVEGRHSFTVTATGGVLGGLVKKLGGDAFHVDSSTTAVQLVGLTEVKQYLDKDLERTEDDEELREFIAAASNLVEEETRLWHRATITERCTPTSVIFLSSLPVVSLTSVEQGATTFDVGSYRLTPGGGVAAAYGWTWAPWALTASLDDVVVTYEAGETVVPPAVRQAVLITVADAWESQRGAAGLPLAEGEGGDLVEPRPEWTLPPEAVGKLRPWLKGPVIA